MKEGKTTLAFKAGALLFIGILLILTGGFFSYKALSSIVRKLHNESLSHSGLTTIKDITVSIETAENNIRLFGITKHPKYIKKYEKLIVEIDSNMSVLSSQYPENEWFNSKFDTINKLIDHKILLCEELITIWQYDSTKNAISSITEEFEQTISDNEKKKIFERIFKFKKGDEKPIDKEKILNKLKELEDTEYKIELKLLEKEKELSGLSNLLSSAFISLMEQLEDYDKKIEKERIANAERIVKKTYNLLAVFSLLGTLLSLSVLILIIKYVQKNKEYNNILITSRREIQKLSKSKELFMANVSHEIRTPLNAISGFIQQILKMPMEDTIKDKIKIIESASNQLIRLINDVLDFSKLQVGKLPLKESHFKAENITDEVCILFSESANKKETNIHCRIENTEGLILFGDSQRYQQILYNLLSNSVKFTENGSIDVSVKLHAIENRNVGLKLIIQDTGLGIETSKIKEIFKEYTQEDQNVAVKHGGTGLGLSIVKKLVELFNGSIHVESQKGMGTKVICDLVFKQGSKDGLIEFPEDTIEINLPENLKFLVVDDEEYNRMLIAAILEKWNIQFDIAKNGLEAIEYLNNNKYNSILMDIRMPVINGVMAAKFIRDTLKLSKEELPVIGITADISNNPYSEVKDLFNAVLIKPFSENELYKIIKYELSNEKTIFTVSNDKLHEKDKKEADLSNLIRVASGDMDFIKDMINQFEESTLKGIKDIQHSVEKEQYEEIAALAHKLAPASRHLGLTKLLSHLKEIEKNAKIKNKTVIINLADKAKESTIKAKDSLWNQYNQLLKK